MRIRDKSLSDYGIDCSRAAELVELARLEENKGLICKAADLSNPGLSTFIIESLTQKRGMTVFILNRIFPLNVMIFTHIAERH